MIKKRFVAIFFLALLGSFALLFASHSLPLHAGVIDDLKREIVDRQQKARDLAAQKKAAKETIAKLEKQERNLATQIALLETQIAELNLEIAITENAIEETQLTIERLTAEVEQTQSQIEKTRSRIALLLQQIYERSDANIIEVVFSSDNFSDVFDRLHAVAVIERGLAGELENLKEFHDELARDRELREEEKLNQEALRGELEDKRGVLENQQDQKEYLLRTTRKEEISYEKLLKNIEAQAKEVQLEVVELEAKLRHTIDQSTLPKGKGVLSWPVETVRLTQGYGATSETGFTNDAYKFHNGIDLGASTPGVSGDPIRAAASGVVVGTGNSDAYCRGAAYGKWIALDHENGLTTMYAHLATIAVSPGKKVTRGQVIGFMDSTGFSTGPHLHFTVYASQTFVIRESNFCGPLPYGGSINPVEYL